MICVPHSLSRRGPALGAQAGEGRLAKIVVGGGVGRFRRATQTPFSLVLEARRQARTGVQSRRDRRGSPGLI
jgi:hypothetical protein